MRRSLVVVVALFAVAAAPAQASDTSVRGTFAQATTTFNGWWTHLGAGRAQMSARADAEASRLTVARTKLQLDQAATAKVRLGRALALQAFGKMVAGCRAWSAYQVDLIADPNLANASTWADSQRASTSFQQARPLLAQAARGLGVKIVLFRFSQP